MGFDELEDVVRKEARISARLGVDVAMEILHGFEKAIFSLFVEVVDDDSGS